LKRLAAIAFFTIILFNFYGYRLVISCIQSSSDAYLEKQVDQNRYDEKDLISIKTKLNLPYYISSDQYERAYGSINISGTNYQYVKRRVHNDTLELLCLPNHTTTKLQTVNNEVAKSFADGQASTPKKNTTIKISLPDFFQTFKIFSATCFLKRKPTFVQHTYFITEGYTLKQLKPPEHTFFISC
jgi:hypothetical protein